MSKAEIEERIEAIERQIANLREELNILVAQAMQWAPLE